MPGETGLSLAWNAVFPTHTHTHARRPVLSVILPSTPNPLSITPTPNSHHKMKNRLKLSEVRTSHCNAVGISRSKILIDAVFESHGTPRLAKPTRQSCLETHIFIVTNDLRHAESSAS